MSSRNSAAARGLRVRVLTAANQAKVTDLLLKKVRAGKMAALKRKEALAALARARGVNAKKYRNEHASLKALANRYSAVGTQIVAQLNRLLYA